MKHPTALIVLLVLSPIHGVNISFVSNVILIADRPASSGVLLTNRTCTQCICLAMRNASFLALNCYPTLTCQLFLRYPRVYKLKSVNNSRLYFLRNIYPNASNPCCVANTTYLLRRLRQAMNSSVPRTVSRPRSLLLDDDGLLATVEEGDQTSSTFDRFNPLTFSLEQRQFLGAKPTNMAYRDRTFYIGWDSNHTISVLNSPNGSNALIYLTTIGASANMSGVRDMIFLDNGQTMVVASTNNKRLVFFSLTNHSDYIMTSNILVNYSYPHGLYRVNDSFFHVIPWSNPAIYAYSYNPAMASWTQTLFANATINGSSSGSHITVDDCNRRWLTMFNYGIRIYDHGGIHLGDWILDSGYFDTVLLDNYVVIMANLDNSKITRFTPQLQCDDD